MFPDSNRRQTSLEKLKPKRHSAKALGLLPSILRGNKSIFHMTLSARGVLWLFLTGAVPAGAVFLTCTGVAAAMANGFFSGAPRHLQGWGKPAGSQQLLSPVLGWRFWRGQNSLALLFPILVLVDSGVPTSSTHRSDAGMWCSALPLRAISSSSWELSQ